MGTGLLSLPPTTCWRVVTAQRVFCDPESHGDVLCYSSESTPLGDQFLSFEGAGQVLATSVEGLSPFPESWSALRLERLRGPGSALLRASGCCQDPGTNDAGQSPHPSGPQGHEHGSPAGGLLPQHVVRPWGTGPRLPLSTALRPWWVPAGRKEWGPLPGLWHNDFKSRAEAAAFWGHLAIQD